jgi:chromosome segregation ATPase
VCCCSNCYAKDKMLFDALARIETALSMIKKTGTQIMQEMDDLKAAVTKLAADIDTDIQAAKDGSTALRTALAAADASVASLTAGDVITAAQIADLQQQLADAKAGATDLTSAVTSADATLTAASANLGVANP